MKLKKPQIFVLVALLCFIIVTIGFSIGTQQYARTQNYNPLLDAQKLTRTYYSPFAIIQWRKQFNQFTPNEFKQSLQAPMIGGGIAFFIFFIAGMILKKKKQPDSHGSARWATDEEFRAKDMTKAEGVMLGKMPNGEYIRDNGAAHIICYAPTRCLIEDTLVTVLTNEVIKDIKIVDVIIGMKVWTGYEWTLVTSAAKSDRPDKAFLIQCDNDITEISTGNHLWPTPRGIIETSNLRTTDKIFTPKNTITDKPSHNSSYMQILCINEIIPDCDKDFYEITVECKNELYMLASGLLTHNSGKGVGIIIPTLLSLNIAAKGLKKRWSMVITDIKGENWAITSKFRQVIFKNKVIKFDPTCTDGTGARFNPLEEIRIRTMDEVKDTQRIVNMIVDPQGKGELDHWGKTAGALLTGLILYVLYTRANKSLSEVASIINDPNEADIGVTLKRMAEEQHSDEETMSRIYEGTTDGKHPIIWNSLLECANKPGDERGSVISTAVSNLALYRDPIIALNTSTSDFKISDLMYGNDPISLYLVIPPSDMDRVIPLTRIIMNQIITTLTEKMEFTDKGIPIEKYNHSLLMLWDEFPAFKNLSIVEAALAFVAGYGIKMLLIVQSLNQLNKIYTKDNSILDNMHIQVAYTPNDNTTAEEISKALDKSTIMVTSQSHEKGMLAGKRDSGVSESGRQLMTPGELRVMPFEDELIFVAGINPYKAKKIMYYADDNFKKRVMGAAKTSDRLYNTTPAVSKREQGRTLESPAADITATAINTLPPITSLSPQPDDMPQRPLEPQEPDDFVLDPKYADIMHTVSFEDDMETCMEDEIALMNSEIASLQTETNNQTISDLIM